MPLPSQRSRPPGRRRNYRGIFPGRTPYRVRTQALQKRASATIYLSEKGRNLKNPEKSPILILMNAVEVIEEIKRLPEEEREKVVEFVRHLPNAETIEAINEPLEGLSRYKSMSEVRKAIKDLVDDA